MIKEMAHSISDIQYNKSSRELDFIEYMYPALQYYAVG